MNTTLIDLGVEVHRLHVRAGRLLELAGAARGRCDPVAALAYRQQAARAEANAECLTNALCLAWEQLGMVSSG